MSYPPDQFADDVDHSIAVVGMAGRFPGAPNLPSFWENLRNGVETIREFTESDLDRLGLPAAVREHPRFVPFGTELPDVDTFDAGFFGLTPREAESIDPQHRILLETVYQAFEDAGYDPWDHPAPIALFAGANPNDYASLLPRTEPSEAGLTFQNLIGNALDTLATRIAHRLDLTGPALTIQTACSTSLVAVHLACESLLSYQCSMAVAGGVSVNLRQQGGYFYQEGMILSPDGHCRAFDAKANGTVLGQGAGAVVLKRLADALEAGDTIHAVIRGSAVNNDGSDKIGFTAPGESGQAAVIAAAHEVAGVTADEISYVEAHGTGTSLGDPVEIAALTRAFRATGDGVGYCAVGSVKTNVGHLDAAAGITGLLKTILALQHREIPPTVHFEQPNPDIDFGRSPFFVNGTLLEWEETAAPRRAGVSSFGIGGTNAHVVVEEAPPRPPSVPGPAWQLLPLSARSPAALDELSRSLADWFAAHPEISPADAAYTLGAGRRSHPHRRIAVAEGIAEAAETLAAPAPSPMRGRTERQPDVVFMFSGQGSQYAGMAVGLYEALDPFRLEVDACAEILTPLLGTDLRVIMFGQDPDGLLNETAFTQPALFVVEYALARQLGQWGIEPHALVGHSIGEYVGATLAGVMTRDEALELVAHRGRLMQSAPPGRMLAVAASEGDLTEFLTDDVTLAVINSSSMCALSGPADAIERLGPVLEQAGIKTQPIVTSHAFHSPSMEPILDEFREAVHRVRLQAPRVPLLSNLTGTWLTAEQATDPGYWVDHLRHTVRFSENLAEIFSNPNRVLLEVGPGRALATFAREHRAWAEDRIAITTLRHPKEDQADVVALLEGVGRMWLAGVEPDWSSLSGSRRRIPLATYPYQRQRYWAAPVMSSLAVSVAHQPAALPNRQLDLDEWFYVPAWTQQTVDSNGAPTPHRWLVFTDEHGVAESLAGILEERGDTVWRVRPGAMFEQDGDRFTIDPASADHYERLAELATTGLAPGRILHAWNVGDVSPGPVDSRALGRSQDLGMYSLMNLARAFGRLDAMTALHFDVVSTGLHDVTGAEAVRPEKATLLGPCKVIPLEYDNMTCRSIDVEAGWAASDATVASLLSELDTPSPDSLVARRGRHRWIEGVQRVRLPAASAPVKDGGVYLILGGLGGIGLALAEHIGRLVSAKLVLVGRSPLPPRTEWDDLPADLPTSDDTARKIAQIRAIEARGAEVLVASADVANRSDMEQVVGEAVGRFGTIDGIIHAAGVIDQAGVIHLRSKEAHEQTIAAKVRGTLIVDELVSELEPDFVLLSSSMSTRLYHNRFGQSGYVAANSFVEAFAASRATSATTTVAIAWDDWQDVGMGARAAGVFADEYGLVDHVVQPIHPLDAFKPVEGLEIFDRALGHGSPTVFISTRDLERRIALDADTRSAFLESAGFVPSPAPDHARPELKTEHVAPRTPTEAATALIWSAVLGIADVGVDDDYFALGGDSLRAAQVIDRMRSEFGLELPINLLFEAPTIATLAARVDALAESAASDGGDATETEIVEGRL